MATSISAVLDDLLETATQQQSITLKELIDSVKQKGLGAAIIALSLICVLPSGAIPFVPALCGVFIILLSVQFILQKETFWIPQSFAKKELTSSKLEKSIKGFRPWAQKLDQLFKNRLTWLNNQVVATMAGLCCILLSMGIIAFGFIPFIALVPGCAILFFGIGMTFSDGLAYLLGFITTGISVYFLMSI